MEVRFIKRNHFKDYYTITSLYNENALSVSFVDKKTYDWFDSCECGDLIPNDFCNIDIYERNNQLNAKVNIKVD